MIYKKTIAISEKEAKKIREYLYIDTKYTGFDDGKEMSYTVSFNNSVRAEIKLCGAYSTADDPAIPFTEGILYVNGEVAALTGQDDSFFGDWEFECGDDIYIVTVEEPAAKAA